METGAKNRWCRELGRKDKEHAERRRTEKRTSTHVIKEREVSEETLDRRNKRETGIYKVEGSE